ncbi:alpha/beta fold hydrolase [Amycolatopsis thermophila]|uniref:Pimeloyl-ACP methyl ester carboxylesterase n=1 Tax=Amycolatopsis thermophila TaxID=206084 RepID=A0ABU0EL69_9PSEU|nr:alpha/beta hydrolase [Amycolatopsis thermophila]MDQ0376024.1 pimeloyl-ACP methyl ester carboxylesterase [Amycolatopsis thermophila]
MSPVLLLHGIGGSSASFESQVNVLSERHRVVAWDAPGYGESPDPERADIGWYAGQAARVFGEPAHVVGVSWGGVIATRLALDHPVLSLTLADSTRGSGTSPEAAARMRARVDELAEVGPAEFARRRAPRLSADPATRAKVEATMARVRLNGYRAAAESMATTDHGPVLGQISVPTLVVVGSADQVTGVEEGRLLAREIPGARLRVIGGGHAANQECPDEFNEVLLEFLSEVEASRCG